jgi:hypothetical protein
VHPASLLSYYPTHALLDEVLSKGYNTLNLYLDLKNVLQSLYMEHSVINLVETTIKSNYTDTSVFASLVSFISFHKVYGAKRNIKLNIFVFFETGDSMYHKNLYKKYKISRKIDTLYGLDSAKRDLFFSILHKNYQLIERAFNLVPRVKVIRLENLEADFIPYYLITRKLVSTDTNVGHIVYSNDHDMFQTISDNVFVFSKSARVKKLIKKGEVMREYLKINTGLDDSLFPISMAVIGCQGDDVDGLKQLGPARTAECIKELVEMGGGLEQIYLNVVHDKPIFPSIELTENLNKYILKIISEEKESKIVSRNLKLVCFEIISRAFDNPCSTEMLDKKNKVVKILNSEDVIDKDILRESLEKSRILFDYDDFSNLYYGV